MSIRTGRGSGTSDRVLRFLPRFDSAQDAIRFATEQGLGWVRESAAPRPRITDIHSQEN